MAVRATWAVAVGDAGWQVRQDGEPARPRQFALHRAYTLPQHPRQRARATPSLPLNGLGLCASWATTPASPRSRAYAAPGCGWMCGGPIYLSKLRIGAKGASVSIGTRVVFPRDYLRRSRSIGDELRTPYGMTPVSPSELGGGGDRAIGIASLVGGGALGGM